MKNRTICILVIMTTTLSLSLVGCMPKKNADSSDYGLDKNWVVLENIDVVKPAIGIAKEISALRGYNIIDWLDNQTILAYKYSETVFGDDRGLVALDLKSGKILRQFETLGTYSDGSVSPDKNKFAYTTKSNANSEFHLNLLDLKTGKTERYVSKDLLGIYKLDPSMFRRNFRWFSGHNAWITLNGNSNALSFGILDNNSITVLNFPTETISKKSQFIYAEYFSKIGSDFFGIVQDFDQSRLFKGQMNSPVLSELPVKKIVNVWALEERQQLLVVQKQKDNITSTLMLMDLEGNVVKTLANIKQLYAIDVFDNSIVYGTQENGNEASLGLINIETGVESFVTTYTQTWIDKMKLSPNGDQLLVSFENGGPSEQGKPISHLIQLK